MKMIIAIIGSEDADDLVYELNQHSFFVTKLSTMGGFLKKKSTTLMLGVEDERVEDAISIIKKMSGAREQRAEFLGGFHSAQSIHIDI